VYEGVSFLNDDQENVLRQHISGDDVSNAIDRYLVLFLALQVSIVMSSDL